MLIGSDRLCKSAIDDDIYEECKLWARGNWKSEVDARVKAWFITALKQQKYEIDYERPVDLKTPNCTLHMVNRSGYNIADFTCTLSYCLRKNDPDSRIGTFQIDVSRWESGNDISVRYFCDSVNASVIELFDADPFVFSVKKDGGEDNHKEKPLSKPLRCEICGSGGLVKINGFYECPSCGVRYTTDEVRKLLRK